MDESHSYELRWKDIELAAKVAPEQHLNALKWISYRLGYLPAQGIYMPYLAIAQSKCDELIKTQKANEESVEENIAIAKQIRNDDMKKGGWLTSQFNNPKYRRAYDEILPMYKHRARELLCQNLGHEPLFEHSFEAEIYLRHMFTIDDYHSGLKFTGMEMKAMTIAHYRSYYDVEGEAAADNCDLIGMMFNAWKIRNDMPISF